MSEVPGRIPGIPRASVIYRPDMPAWQPGIERYRVRGGGSMVVPVYAGDRFTVTDIEGEQVCEVAFCDEQGVFDCAAFGAPPDGRGEGLLEILKGDSESAVRLRRSLQRRGVDPAKAETLRIFGAGSAAGARAELSVARDGLLLVVAPGRAMDPGTQDTATPVELRIKRHRLPDAKQAVLPEPLGDPLQDMRIDARTASAYFVRAGEFIQVIDVSGRQCTDFQAFAARKIDRGKDLGLDATVTARFWGAVIRCLACHPRPSTGSSSRWWRSCRTRGPPDAFATACNARYYEDMGYPGRQLHGELQQGAGALRHRPTPRLGGPQLFLQHEYRPAQSALPG
jgi:aminomethyltransferase